MIILKMHILWFLSTYAYKFSGMLMMSYKPATYKFLQLCFLTSCTASALSLVMAGNPFESGKTLVFMSKDDASTNHYLDSSPSLDYKKDQVFLRQSIDYTKYPAHIGQFKK